MAESFEDLDALPLEELRHRAFRLAEHRHDLGFFWDLLQHLPSSLGLATEDASSGNIGGSIDETVEMVKQLKGEDLAGDEPLLRAHFIDYLMQHDADS